MKRWRQAPISRRSRLMLAILFCAAMLLIASGSLRSLAQDNQASVETLFGTPPLMSIPPDTSVTLHRITYRPGEALELDYPGPIMLYVERGELAVPESVSGKPIVLLYSGPDTSPPPVRSDNGEQVLPPGYAVLVESGRLGMTRNAGAEPTSALAVFLIPERTEEMATAVEEATEGP